MVGAQPGVETVVVGVVVDAHEAVAPLLRPRKNLLAQGAAQEEHKVHGAVLDGSCIAADGPRPPLKNVPANQGAATARGRTRGTRVLPPPHLSPTHLKGVAPAAAQAAAPLGDTQLFTVPVGHPLAVPVKPPHEGAPPPEVRAPRLGAPVVPLAPPRQVDRPGASP